MPKKISLFHHFKKSFAQKNPQNSDVMRSLKANDIWLVGSVVFFQVCLVTNLTVLLEILGKLQFQRGSKVVFFWILNTNDSQRFIHFHYYFSRFEWMTIAGVFNLSHWPIWFCLFSLTWRNCWSQLLEALVLPLRTCYLNWCLVDAVDFLSFMDQSRWSIRNTILTGGMEQM